MTQVHDKLLIIQSKISSIEKEGFNSFSKYSYVMLGTMLERIAPLLKELNLVLTFSEIESNADIIFTEDGKFYSKGYSVVEGTLTDVESGTQEKATASGFALDKNGDKALFKANTGARKYVVASLFRVHWDAVEPEDDEHDINNPKKATKVSKTPTQTKTNTSEDLF